MSLEAFNILVEKIGSAVANKTLDSELEAYLNGQFGPQSREFAELFDLCAMGEREGWLMQREAGGIRYGRAVKPGKSAGSFSVDVVRMRDVAGPHHVHTRGEIGVIMPIEGEPLFDGKPKGWYVYPAGSDHQPTVTGGDAYVLYLLPGGEIQFTSS